MGFETVLFPVPNTLEENTPEDIVVGGIGTVYTALRQFGITPEEIDYPLSIQKYLKRKVWKSSMNAVRLNALQWPVFVKPVQGKLFTGKVIREYRDLIGLTSASDRQDVLCSEVVSIVSEYRVFIRYGEILDIRHYNGNWEKYPDPDFIQSCIRDYTDSPAAYGADFGGNRHRRKYPH